MKGDMPAAALRLSCALPVHTHIGRPVLSSKPQGSKFGRSITIDGVTHESIHAAKKKLRVCNATIYGWLAEGRARR